MRRLPVAGLVLAGVLATLTAAPARADTPTADGFLCRLEERADDVTGDRVARISGGPVLITEANGVVPETGLFVCGVRFRADLSAPADHTGSGPQTARQGTGVFTAGPGEYPWPSTGYTWLCTEFLDDSDNVTYYWDDAQGEWSTDPAVPCLFAPKSDEPPVPLVDQLVCPVLVLLFPPEGDVPDLWDCPPYE